MKKILTVCIALTLSACAIPEEDYPEAYGDAACDFLRECQRGDYERLYDEHEDCVDDLADGMDFLMDGLDLLGLSYDEEEGRECINELRDLECGGDVAEAFACAGYN